MVSAKCFFGGDQRLFNKSWKKWLLSIEKQAKQAVAMSQKSTQFSSVTLHGIVKFHLEIKKNSDGDEQLNFAVIWKRDHLQLNFHQNKDCVIRGNISRLRNQILGNVVVIKSQSSKDNLICTAWKQTSYWYNVSSPGIIQHAFWGSRVEFQQTLFINVLARLIKPLRIVMNS